MGFASRVLRKLGLQRATAAAPVPHIDPELLDRDMAQLRQELAAQRRDIGALQEGTAMAVPHGDHERLEQIMAALQQDVAAQRRDIGMLQSQADIVYTMLYQMAHDDEQAAPFATQSTVHAFGHQWANMQEGAFMLSDPVFKAEVDEIISTQELQIARSWFPGKRVLDAGCGGGRWSYGLARLGCEMTAVDVNASAIAATRNALDSLGVKGTFIQSEIELLGEKLAPESFDLVWSWGVLHHCKSFNRALQSAASLVKPGGMIHLYLYGRDSIPLADDVQLFKKRMRYNFLTSADAQEQFLKEMAGVHGLDVHHVHDIYAPLINRRYTFTDVAERLHRLGFGHVEQTIVHGEVWARGIKGPSVEALKPYFLPKIQAPYWFERDTPSV